MITKEAYEKAVESKGQYDDPCCGVYKCIIKSAEDVAEKEYIRVEYDIVDGKYKGYAADCKERAGFSPLNLFLSYKEKAQGMFKHRIKAIESFNKGYVFDFNASSLVGKYFVCTIQTEDYTKQNGKIGKKHNCYDIISREDYEAEKYTIPEHLPLATTSAPAVGGFVEVPNEGDLPF